MTDHPSTTPAPTPRTFELEVGVILYRTIDAVVMAIAEQMNRDDPISAEAEIYESIAETYAEKARHARAYVKKRGE